MIDTKIAAQIAGTTDYRTDEPSDHQITALEHAMAVDVGHEIADRLGIDLDAHIAAFRAKNP